MYKVHLPASGPEAASIASIPSLLLLQGQTVVRFAAPTTEPRWRLHKCFGTSVTVPILLFYKLKQFLFMGTFLCAKYSMNLVYLGGERYK